jgi:hypothetical protein
MLLKIFSSASLPTYTAKDEKLLDIGKFDRLGFALMKLMGITEAAAKLNLSPSTLRRLEKLGQVSPGRTPGGHRRYTEEQLEDLRVYLEKKTLRRSVFRGVTLGD